RIQGHRQTHQLLADAVVQVDGSRAPRALLCADQLASVLPHPLLLLAQTVAEFNELGDVSCDAPDTHQLARFDDAAEPGDVGELTGTGGDAELQAVHRIAA